MIIVMNPDASKEQIEHVVEKVETRGLNALVTHGTQRDVICCIGDETCLDRDSLASIKGVESVTPILAPYKMASKEFQREPTEIKVGKCKFGGEGIGVIAGPCTVESREQILETARYVREKGAIALRGGAFKPRTSPYTFQGLREEGLEYLALAKEETGLPIVTEVMSPEHVPIVGKYADVLQIGTRNMQNYMLLEAVGKIQKPVVLKRGISATLEEWLLAAEYIMSNGNRDVILCERGIRTFESHTRFTLSLSVIPALKDMSHLPIIVDPSHGTGHMSMVRAMSKASIAAGADGLLIEVHPEPENAMLDGAQSVNLPEFQRIMSECSPVASAVGRNFFDH